MFIDDHKDMYTDGLRWGIEPICKVLQVSPSSYRSMKRRPPSRRQLSDAALAIEIRRVFDDNFGVYGIEKIWHQLRREGHTVGRDQVARIMRSEGISGIRRGAKAPFTTIPGDVDDRPDRVKRNFTAPAPNRVWVADLTYVRTFAGWVYVAFIIDVYSRMIVGWQASTRLRSDLALDALEMALWARRGLDLAGLVHHSDRGVQYLSIRYSERLADAGLEPSVGSKGDSFDNALAETTNGLYKTELIHRRTWTGIDDVEIATLEYVDWFNQRRLHTACTMTPPAEYEQHYYAHLRASQLVQTP
jgi:putative transposase